MAVVKVKSVSYIHPSDGESSKPVEKVVLQKEALLEEQIGMRGRSVDEEYFVSHPKTVLLQHEIFHDEKEAFKDENCLEITPFFKEMVLFSYFCKFLNS